jgi:aminoglycoside 3'-phosphotransferase II
VARFIRNDVAAALMTDLGSRTAEHIGSSDWHGWVREIGRAFAHLHSLPVRVCPFDETLGVRLSRAAAAVQSGCVDPGDFDERNRGVAPNELYERLVASMPEREDRVITHGDATLSNLILTGHGQIGFVDCSHVGKADRYVDLALLVAGLEERFGTGALAAFGEGYGGLSWDSQKSKFYLDLYELF